MARRALSDGPGWKYSYQLRQVRDTCAMMADNVHREPRSFAWNRPIIHGLLQGGNGSQCLARRILAIMPLRRFGIDNLTDPRRIANRLLRHVKGNQASYADDRTIHSGQLADARAGIGGRGISHASGQTVPERVGGGNITTLGDAGFVLFAGHSHSLSLWKMAGWHR